MAATPNILTEMKEGVAIVSFTEMRILDELAVNAIGEQFDELAGQDTILKVVLNFKGVDRMSSAVIGKIIGLFNRLSKKSGALRLCGLNDVIREVFTITSLDNVLGIHDDLASALRSLK